MLAVAIALTAAVFPALFLMWWFWKSDKFPEPPVVVWTTFAFGIVIVIPIFFFAAALEPIVRAQTSLWTGALAQALFQAAIPEDLTKFCVLFFYCARRTHFNEPMDGVVYGAAASMGFAAFENVLYVLEGGLGVALARALTAVPSHCANGIIMGYFIALYELSRRDAYGRRTRRGKPAYLAAAVALPVLLHTLYDFPLMLIENAGDDPALHGYFMITFATLAAELYLAVKLFKTVRAKQAAALPAM